MPWVLLDPIPQKHTAEINREITAIGHFLVDENIDPELAAWINRSGIWKADHVRDVGLAGMDDKAVFAWAWKHKRWILTHDEDFLDDHRFPFHRTHGVVVLPGGQGESQARREALWDVLGILGYHSRLFPGAKIVVAPGRIWTVREHLKAEGKHTKRRIRWEKNGRLSEWID